MNCITSKDVNSGAAILKIVLDNRNVGNLNPIRIMQIAREVAALLFNAPGNQEALANAIIRRHFVLDKTYGEPK